MEDTKKDDTIKPDFSCEICDYFTCHRGHWKKHINTSKHKMRCLIFLKTRKSPKVTTAFSQYVCYCGKQYSNSTSLSRHRKNCKFLDEEMKKIDEGTKYNTQPLKNENQSEEKTEKVFLDRKTYELMEENSKLKDNMINVLQSKPSIISNGDNNTFNSNHNTLKINVYLDQNYKEAMTLEDFVQNIQCSIEDLNFTANQGYVKGVSNIFKKNLEVLDPKSRPIHCGDIKGDQIYIRDANHWEEDGGKLNSEIDNVAKKQITMINEWESLHPDWHKNEALTHQYLNLVRQLTSTNNDGGNEQIRKNVAKTVMLDEISVNLN
jgi:hypothetical protein